jgi:hypothetical protein
MDALGMGSPDEGEKGRAVVALAALVGEEVGARRRVPSRRVLALGGVEHPGRGRRHLVQRRTVRRLRQNRLVGGDGENGRERGGRKQLHGAGL